MMLLRFLCVAILIVVTIALPHDFFDDLDDHDFIVVEPEERRPYSFAWKASRHFNGLPDREHIEERDEEGITRGVYRYVDPRHKVQEVVYLSDSDGFHVEATNLPKNTVAVDAERQRHLQLFDKIANDHARIGEQHRQQQEAEAILRSQRPVQIQHPSGQYNRNQHKKQEVYVDPRQHLQTSHAFLPSGSLPRHRPVVQRARERHLNQYETIRQEHQRIGNQIASLKSRRFRRF